MAERYRIVSDDDCHNYIIPAERFWEWDSFVEGRGGSEYDLWAVPAWATRIDHFSNITFENWHEE